MLEDGNVTLPANRNYSTTFEINNGTRTRNMSGPNFSEIHVYVIYMCSAVKCSMTCVFSAETFDVQHAIVEVIGSEIEITVHFVSNSPVMGCIVVLQSDNSNDDEFIVILKKDAVNVSRISPRPSNYTVYLFDLEIPEDRYISASIQYTNIKVEPSKLT